MGKKKNLGQKLQLSRETLRKLVDSQLAEVGGGAMSNINRDCSTRTYGKCYGDFCPSDICL